MKKLKLLGIALLVSFSALSQASIVNVISSDGAFAGNSVAQYETLSLLSNAEIANSLSDNDAGTYLFGSTSNGTVSSANLTLAFQNSVANQAGDDIAFYFMGGSTEINSMRICFTDNCSPSQIFDASFIGDLGVTIGSNTFALSVVTIDLSAFGFANDAILGDFTIDIIAGGYNRLASIDNLNTSPVPLPAPFLLLISGLAGLGFIGRRKK